MGQLHIHNLSMFSSLTAFDNTLVLWSMFPFVLNMWLCTKAKTLFSVNSKKERRSYCKTGMESSHDGPSSVIRCACKSPTAFHCVLHISIQEWRRVSHIWIFQRSRLYIENIGTGTNTGGNPEPKKTATVLNELPELNLKHLSIRCSSDLHSYRYVFHTYHEVYFLVLEGLFPLLIWLW